MNPTVYKKSADELFARLMLGLKNSDGSLHPQSFLCALGSLAGYACQQDVINEYVRGKGLAPENVFDIIPSKSGEKFFFSELVDNKLAGDDHSVWTYVSAVLVKANSAAPDVKEIFEHSIKSCGSEDFGRVRGCETGEDIRGYVSLMWKPAEQIISECPQGTMYAAVAMAAQKAMNAFRSVLPLTEQARIIMESAAAAARLSLAG
ncbi:MAG: hypothetical protein IJM32_08910 [Ruminococcus sp.]|nr:hypothetical protein [Ruminococcus sp.]